MRKIKVFIATSLDGYIATEFGSVDWLPEKVESGYEEFYKTIDTVLMGRKTYGQILTFGAYPYEGKKSYVFTKNPDQEKDKNVEFVSSIDEFLSDKLDLTKGDNIWLVGGADLISHFLNRKLVDEVIVSIIPLSLGRGIPLFKNLKQVVNMEVVKTTQYKYLVELHYKIIKK